VIATARRQQRLNDLVAASKQNKNAGPVSGKIIPIAGDQTDPVVRQAVIDTANEAGDGRIDLLVNNAGVGAIGPFAEASPQRLRHIMEVNFFAPLELTRNCLPNLRLGRSPVICNIGSVLGHRAVPNKSEYCASKFAMHGFSDALRAELVGDGIQVTLVSPSTTDSEFFDSLVDTDEGQTSKSFGSWPPDKVAATTMSAIESRRSEVILSLGGKALVYADRFAPPVMNAILRQR
jgi:short-subunit dehydrogenase